MPTLFKRLFGKGLPPQSALLVSRAQALYRGTGLDVYQGDDDPGDYAVTRYPPFDKGIPATGVEKILHAQQELLDQIFRTAGVSRADFDRLYMPAISNLARHVHLLPATSMTYFRGTGGLYRMSLEIALHSLRSANASVFPTGGGVERRYFMQPKWTLATFLAGLCCQTYRTVNSMAVMTRDNLQWTPLLDALYDWCTNNKADVYFVRWMEDTHVHGAQASSAYSISQVVPHEILQYLASDNNQVVPSMTAAIAAVETNTSENPIGRLVAPVITQVIENDSKRSATNYGHLVIGAHLEMHLVDAMRRLVRGGKWIANNAASGGRVWVGQEGVFIDWPVAAGDIANLLARDSFAGIPKDPDTLADLLVSANLLQPNARGARYWTIALPGTLEAKDGMVKLREGAVIFPQGFDFEPFRNVQLTLAAAPTTQAATHVPTSATTQLATASQPTHDQQSASSHAKISGSQPETATTTSTDPSATNKKDQPRKEKQKNTAKAAADQSGQKIEATAITSPEENSGPLLGVEVSPTAKKLLGSLKRSNAWLLNEVMTACRNKTMTGVTAALPYGFGISHDELSLHGIPVMELLEELALKAWLWQDKTRSSRRIHPVEIDGKIHRMVILKPDIAAGLGFDTVVRE